MRKQRIFSEILRDQILGLFHTLDNKPLTEQELITSLSLRGKAKKNLRLLLATMVFSGELVQIHQNRYSLAKPADLVVGKIDIMRSGNAIVSPADKTPEVFIQRGNLNTALPDDLVLVRLDRAKTNLRRTGNVIRILQRSKRAVVGTLKSTQHFYYVVPLDPAYTRDFYVSDKKGAKVGDRVVAQFAEWSDKHVNPEAEIVEVLGPSSNPSLDTLAILRQYNLPESFPLEVMRESEKLQEKLRKDKNERRDLRDRFIFTIDPAVSRDFDDAISLETDKHGRRVLGVHIADVSHFVKPGTTIDKEAQCRGNSVYLPDMVIPMLPEQLSNWLCSLRPNEDKLTFSVFLTFDQNATVLKREFCRSIIRSKLRLTYEQAFSALSDSLKESHKKRGITKNALSVLRQIHELAQQLRQRRFALYALNLDVPEYEVVIGQDGMILDILQTQNDISHQLIEECMIAANEAVTRFLSARGIEILNRVHEPPSQEKIEMLSAQLRELGFQPHNLSSRKNIALFLNSIRAHPLEYDATIAVLKSMKRAIYSPSALGHYGLAKKYYTHFTSPIRRYPDLVVHRILSACLAKGKRIYNHTELVNLAKHTSKTERIADESEKMLIELKKYRFLEQQIKEQKKNSYEAIVVSIKNFGMFVELAKLQIQGLVHISSISTGFVRYDRSRQILQDGRVKYSVGMRVNVLPVKVDFEKREIDFALTNHISSSTHARLPKKKVKRRHKL